VLVVATRKAVSNITPFSDRDETDEASCELDDDDERNLG